MMEDLRSWWEVPSIAHYCSLFRTAFDLADFDIEDIEEALLESEKEEGSDFILDLVCRLLNGCYGRKDVTPSNFDLYVKDVIKFKWGEEENPIKEKTEFKQLTLREKVEFILSLCEYRLDTEDVAELLKGFEGDNMRVEPLGKDKDGSTYWYFYGSRLYKEDPKKEPNNSEKRALAKKKKKLDKQKRREEQRREKERLKERKKLEKKKKLEETLRKKEENKKSNIRRSGRIKLKQLEEEIESESHESTMSSSSETEVSEESSTEEEEEEEEVKPARGRGKKSQGKQQTIKNTPAKETPSRQGKRGRLGNNSRSMSQTPKTPQTPAMDDSSLRRSGRMRRPKGTPAPRPAKPLYDSSDTEDNEVDSGHESAESDDDNKSVRSEMSKVSTHSTPVGRGRQARKPQSKMELKRSAVDADEDDHEDENEKDDTPSIKPGKGSSKVSVKGGKGGDDVKHNEKDAGNETKKHDMEKTQTNDKEIEDVELQENKVEGKMADKVEGMDIDLVVKSKTGDTIATVSESELKDQTEVLESIVSVTEADKEEAPMDVVSGEVEATNVSEAGMVSEEMGPGGQDVQGDGEEIDGDKEELNSDRESQNKHCSPNGSLQDSINKVPETGSGKVDQGLDSPRTSTGEGLQSETMEMEAPAMPANDGEDEENQSETAMEDSEEIRNEPLSEIKYESIKSESEEIHTKQTDNTAEECKEELQNDGADSVNLNIDSTNLDNIKQEILNGDELSNDETRKNKKALKKTDKEEEDENEDTEPDCKPESKLCVSAMSSEPMLASKSKLPPVAELAAKPISKPISGPRETGWYLVCQTLDDWVVLADLFKDSTVRCEKSLAKVIREDFIPVLPEIIEAREAEKKKRIQDLEVRRSSRLTIKQMEKLEQERILAEALAEEEKARIREEDDRRVKEEQLRLEEENRQREERIRAREERAKRLSMREEKARLLAEGKEIPPELIYTGSHKYKDDSDSDDSRCDLKDEESYETLIKIIDAMKLHKDCWPFLEPVTDEVAPGYSDVIKRPMDMSKIEEKVKTREYRSSQHFLSDFRLMFNNCKRFNGQDSEFTECARSMEKMLKKYVKKFLSDEPLDKYYADKDFTVSVKGSGGEKRYRPKRAASSRALQTVHKALNSDYEEESSEDSDDLEPLYNRQKASKDSPFKTPSHNSLLLQEMIEMKRQREKKLAGIALENHRVITRGPDRIRVQTPSGGVMIIPKDELPPTGVLRLAATREIRRKVHPKPIVDVSKKDPSLNVIDKSKLGSQTPKTIRIVTAQGPNGQASVKETAESVRVSADGFLIISGKNSGIRVTENTKIVIQPPPNTNAAGSEGQPAQMAKEILIKKLPSQSPAGRSADKFAIQAAVSKSPTMVHTMTIPQRVVKTSSPAQPTKQMSEQDRQEELERMIQQTKQEAKALNLKGESTAADQRQKDITQRILVLNQQKRKLMLQRQQAQQQQQKQQQQNGEATGPSPSKIMRLDPGDSSATTSQSSIEDRLRETSPDNPIGQVTKQIVGSVNISNDILDTYYSVLNASKTPPVTSHKVTNEPSASVISNANVSQVQMTVTGEGNSVTTIPSYCVTPDVSVQSNGPGSGSVVNLISMTTNSNFVTSPDVIDSQYLCNQQHLCNNILQQTLTATNLSHSNGACLDQGNITVSSHPANAPLMQSEVGVSIDSFVPTVVQTDVIVSSAAGEGSSVVVDTLNGSEPSSAIEALFSSSLPSTITLPTSVVEAGDNAKTISRQNLFDMFDSGIPTNSSVDLVGVIPSAGLLNESGGILPGNVASGNGEAGPNKMTSIPAIPTTASVRFSSPLKTAAIMDALKMKLSPNKSAKLQGPNVPSLNNQDLNTSQTETVSVAATVVSPEIAETTLQDMETL